LLLLVCCLFSLSSSFALTLRNWFLWVRTAWSQLPAIRRARQHRVPEDRSARHLAHLRLRRLWRQWPYWPWLHGEPLESALPCRLAFHHRRRSHSDRLWFRYAF
jgi:hypothetical protein